MTEKQAEEFVKKNLVDYLARSGHFPDNAGRYHCISADHIDGNPSMTIEKNGKYAKCWSHPEPHDTFSIFDVIGMVEGIRSSRAQKRRAFEIYHIEVDETSKETANAKSDKPSKSGQANPPVTVLPDFASPIQPDELTEPEPAVEVVEVAPAVAEPTEPEPEAAAAEPAVEVVEVAPVAAEPTELEPEAAATEPAVEVVAVAPAAAEPTEPEPEAAAAEPAAEVVEAEPAADEPTELEPEAAAAEPAAEVVAVEPAAVEPAEPEPEAAAAEPAVEVVAVEPAVAIINEPFQVVPDHVTSKTEIPVTVKQADSMMDFLKQQSMAVYLNDYAAVIQDASLHPVVPTGFAELDNLLDGGLFPGLYVVCSRPAEGKTTFTLQIADFMTAHDQEVLLISLDQTRMEIAAKTLSRLTLLMDETISKRNARTAREMMDLSHNLPQTFSEQAIIDKAIDKYRQSAQYLYICECLSPTSLTDIQSMINQHKTATGHDPVVILDNLQYLKPAEPGQSDSQNADLSVRILMQISRACQIPIIALSGAIRDNYGSDVVLSMQMEPAAGTLASPHQVELRILKNRYGPTGGKVSFHFYAAYSYFEAAKSEKVLV